jgi:putative MATE family efflux protein
MVETEQSPQKDSYYKREWTRGPIISNLLLLSWPMVLMETLYVISQAVDMVWVGKLGSSAIAGLGIANIVIMLIISMDMGVVVGVRAMVARYVGAGDYRGANQIAGQAILLSAFWGAMMTIVGLSLSGPILNLFRLEADVAVAGMTYLRILFAAWIAMDVWIMGLYVIQSSGDTINPMLIEAVMRVFHVALCPFLVLGWWIFPRMGISGAALSNAIFQSLGAVAVLWFLFSGRTRLKITLGDLRFSPDILLRIFKIGIPASVMSIQRAFGNMILTWVIAPFGTLAVAAHSLGTRVEMFIFLPSMGLGMGSGVLVGQNLGARQPERAEKSAWTALGFVEAFTVCCAIVILLWAENVVSVFNNEPGLVDIGSLFLRIAAVSYVVIGLVAVLQNSIAGAGDTLPNMIISIGMIWVVTVPLAFLLPQIGDLGVLGVRWAMVAGMAGGAAAYVIYFRLGRWKKKKV